VEPFITTAIWPFPLEDVKMPLLVQSVPTLIVCVVVGPGLLQVIVPLIVTKVAIVRVRAVGLFPIVSIPLPLIVRDLIVVEVLRTTLCPEHIITSSPAPGGVTAFAAPPHVVIDHVLLVFQEPLTLE
jgi:hypothetical protein